MRKRRDRLVLRIAQEMGQKVEQFAEHNKVKLFDLELFLKTYKRTKIGMHTWKSSQHGDGKEQE